MIVAWNDRNKGLASEYGEGPFEVIFEGEADEMKYYRLKVKTGEYNFYAHRFDILPEVILPYEDMI